VGPNTHGDFHVTDPSGAPVHLGPDNTYLEIWVWGGLLGIGSFLYLLGSAFVVLWKRLRARYTQESIALFGIVLALSIAIFFDASLSLYWFFIILALILRPHEISAR
jgi:O-antigen ligase